MAAQSDNFHFINFVDASSALQSVDQGCVKKSFGKLPLSGEQAKDYYDDLLKISNEGPEIVNIGDVSSEDEDELKIISDNTKTSTSDIDIVYEHNNSRKPKSAEARHKKFWCQVCKSYSNDTKSVHANSIAHQFKETMTLGANSASVGFYISASNIGYQLLLGQGWDSKSGLGPTKNGNKFPVKTVHKLDRSGLGLGKEIARITHSCPSSITKPVLGQYHNLSTNRKKLKPKQLMSIAKLQESLIKKSVYES